MCFRLRTSEEELKNCISNLKHWIIQDDINAISTRYQDGSPEKESEEETETETETDGSAIKDPYFPKALSVKVAEVTDLCQWIHENYNSDDLPSSTMPLIENYSAIFGVPMVRKAIENKIKLCDLKGQGARYRPRIKNLFETKESVRELAEMDVEAIKNASGRDVGLDDVMKKIKEKYGE